MIQKISNIRFSSLSMMDDFGRVFFQDGRVYRAIHNDKKDYCLKLLNSELFKELSAKKLIPATTVADFTINGSELILEHEKLLQTLQHEWSFTMFKDAAKLVLQVNEICSKYNYELKDAHTLNVLFRGCSEPVWIDIGSISPKASNNWMALEEFKGSFLLPLIFWSQNKTFITRKLLESNFYRMATIPDQSFRDSGLLKLLPVAQQSYIFKFRSRKLFSTNNKVDFLSTFSQIIRTSINKLTLRKTQFFSYSASEPENSEAKFINELFNCNKVDDLIESIPQPKVESKWQGYHTSYYSKNGNIIYSQRFKRILAIIRNIENISSILDLAGNEGFFSNLLCNELHIERVIIADYDENAIDEAYKTFKSSKSGKVNTILLNFMFTPDIIGTSKRLKSDLVIALAVTHHLILTNKFSLPAIFERLRLYSKRYVMVEFMPLGLWAITDKLLPKIPEWYDRNWFKTEFEKYFKLQIEEKLEDNRILFFGEII